MEMTSPANGDRVTGAGSDDEEDGEERLLILRFQRGDRDAVAALYERYFDRIYAYMRASVRQAADAEDLAQQVFANALAALRSYDVNGTAAFRVWLFVVARNQLLKFLRTRGRVRALAPQELAEHIDHGQTAPDPSDQASSWTIGATLAELPVRQRQVLVLTFSGDLTTTEIARVLNISVSAVHKARQRGLASLAARWMDGDHMSDGQDGRDRSNGRDVARVETTREDPAIPARRVGLSAT